jgi:hypothetical protein
MRMSKESDFVEQEILGYKKTSFWETMQQELLNDEDYDPEDHDFLIMISQGRYRDLLNEQETLYDCHIIYDRILEELTTDILTDSLYCAMELEEKEDDLTYDDIIYAFEKEKMKLEFVFNECTVKFVKPINNTIEMHKKTFDNPKKKQNMMKH